jgi:GNAT superfamily N-acetyltransferase
MGSQKMTDPTFVRACSADLERVLSFVKTYYEFDARFSATEVRSGLEALLRDLSLGQVWLIRVGHEDVGYVVLTFGYDLEFGGPQATITELYIVDRYRRLGLGTKTLRFVEATCRDMEQSFDERSVLESAPAVPASLHERPRNQRNAITRNTSYAMSFSSKNALFIPYRTVRARYGTGNLEGRIREFSVRFESLSVSDCTKISVEKLVAKMEGLDCTLVN